MLKLGVVLAVWGLAAVLFALAWCIIMRRRDWSPPRTLYRSGVGTDRQGMKPRIDRIPNNSISS